jgi:hypothetical protein
MDLNSTRSQIIADFFQIQISIPQVPQSAAFFMPQIDKFFTHLHKNLRRMDA